MKNIFTISSSEALRRTTYSKNSSYENEQNIKYIIST